MNNPPPTAPPAGPARLEPVDSLRQLPFTASGIVVFDALTVDGREVAAPSADRWRQHPPRWHYELPLAVLVQPPAGGDAEHVGFLHTVQIGTGPLPARVRGTGVLDLTAVDAVHPDLAARLALGHDVGVEADLGGGYHLYRLSPDAEPVTEQEWAAAPPDTPATTVHYGWTLTAVFLGDRPAWSWAVARLDAPVMEELPPPGRRAARENAPAADPDRADAGADVERTDR